MKTALSIAGSDCSGGAGIQADIKTMSALGVYAMSVITSVVAENTSRVLAQKQVGYDMISLQLDAVFSDIKVDAVKIGMIPSASIMKLVARKIKRYGPNHVIVDPVMYSKDGTPLMREDSRSEFMRSILPLATMLTPNIPEAELITGFKIKTIDHMKEAARRIVGLGIKSVLIKGGHYDGDAVDVFYDGQYALFSHERILTKNTHGTGCTLSSAIAALLARGYKPIEAVKKAKEYITEAIKYSFDIGHGNGPLNHFFNYMGDKKTIDYSLYLVTDRHNCTDIFSATEEAIKGGVTVVQLREKELKGEEFYFVAQKMRDLTLRYNVPLIINDRVDVALAVHADGVHVGQSDLPCSSVRKFVGEKMIIGVTAHSLAEAVKAQEDGADYIGVGAMASSGTKNDAKVIGSGELNSIIDAVDIPIVIIGGINVSNITAFKNPKIDGVAVSSAIMRSVDPLESAKELRRLWEK